ncbi:putative transcriptional regulator of viral defense system [Lachnospiraceae bacterium PM6-15]|uniref:type IV toxin-antitoxin system AbiEi family antitoxin domain-containing protein n=1 Tax=Ohessyouella blattaphilus TaxID=2949333 RepID=UPI003E219D12
MRKANELDKMVMEGNGYLLTSEVVRAGIAKDTLAKYVKYRNLEKVARGVYMSDEAWPDELYILYLRNGKIFYSQETALFLHGLMEREPRKIQVTVKAGYNAAHLREKGVSVYQVQEKLYEVGASKISTNFGNTVGVYDMERTMCDLIRDKEKVDIQVFQVAMKEYMGSSEKSIPNLMKYAGMFGIEDKVRSYLEVML